MAETVKNTPINAVGLGKLPKVDCRNNNSNFYKDINERGKVEIWVKPLSLILIMIICLRVSKAELLERHVDLKHAQLLSGKQTFEENVEMTETLAVECIDIFKEVADENKRLINLLVYPQYGRLCGYFFKMYWPL